MDFEPVKSLDENPILKSLKKDLEYYNDYILGFSREILDSGISKYPIFIAYQSGAVKLGSQVIDHSSLYTTWSINASALEEFVKKDIIARDKVDAFRQHYKDPETHMCVFVVVANEAGFAYLPFKKESNY